MITISPTGAPIGDYSAKQLSKYRADTVPTEIWLNLLQAREASTLSDLTQLSLDLKLYELRDDAGRGPLTVAADNGRLDLVEALLKSDGSRRELKELKGRVLLGAILKRHTSVLETLIQVDNTIINSSCFDFDSPLEAAARTGNIEAFKLLLAAGATLFRSEPTWSALHGAVAADRVDFVKWAFMEHRERILGSSSLLKYLIDWAVLGDAVDVLRWLVNAPEASEFDARTWLKVRPIMDRKLTSGPPKCLYLIEFICTFGCSELLAWCLDEFAMEGVNEPESISPWSQLPSTPERCALLAIENGHPHLLPMLFDHGLVISTDDGFHCRGLWFVAARVGNIELLEKGLAAGRDISSLSNNRLPAVSEAAMHGQLEAVKFLTNHGATLSHHGPNASPLQLACDRGYETVALWLRDRMIEDKLETEVLSSRIIHACVGGRLFDCIMWLSERIPDMMAKVEHKDTLLDVPLLEGQASFVRRLLDEPTLRVSIRSHCSPMTLLQCVSRGHEECVKLIVEKGGDEFVNYPAFYTYRPGSLWHSCFQYNSQELWKWLIHNRPKAISSGWAPGEPASMAVQFGRIDMLRTLIANFDVSLTHPKLQIDGFGTALHLAARLCRSPAMIGFLMEALPDALETLDSFGRTPLLVAATYANKEAIVALVKAGAEIHGEDFSGADLIDLLFTADREGQALAYLFRNCSESFNRVYFRPKHIEMAATKPDPAFLSHLLDHVYPDFAHPQKSSALGLSHIHYLFTKATLHELHDMLIWLAKRFNRPEHLPPKLFYELRMYQSLTNAPRWKELYYLGLVGRYMQGKPAALVEAEEEHDALLEDPMNGSGDQIPNEHFFGGRFHDAGVLSQLRPAAADGLIAACLAGNLKLVSLYYSFGASLQRRHSVSGITPVLAACASSGPKLKLILWLVSKGCSLFDTDYAGNGVLHYMSPGDPLAQAFLREQMGLPHQRPAVRS